MANEAPKVHVGAVARQFKVTEALAVERGATRSRGASREGTRAAEEAERAREEEESAGESIGELSYCSTLPHSDLGSLSLLLSAAPSQPTATISISISISICIQLSSPVGWLVIPCIFNMLHTEHHERKASHRPRLRHTVCGSNERMNEWHGCGC